MTTRIVASCSLCGKPIVEQVKEGEGYYAERTLSSYSDEAWMLLLNGKPAHVSCANEATKEW